MQIHAIPFLSLVLLVNVASAQSIATRPAATKPATTQQATPDNLVIEGIPPIPGEVIERVRRYTEFRAALPLSWHPVRREMLIATRFADTAQVHYVKMPGGARTQMTFSKEPIDNASFQPTAGESFVYSTDIGGSEFDQIFRYDLATGESTLLTDGKSRNSRGPWSRDGKWIAYTSTRRTGADSDLYVVNPADKSTDRRVAEVKGGGWAPADWSPEGKTLLVGEYVSINESYLWLFDVKTGERTEFTPRNLGGAEKVAYDDAVFARDGKGVYATTDKESPFRRLAYIDAATKEHTYLTAHIPWDVESFELSDDGKRIALVTNEDGISRLRLMDTATRTEQPVEGIPVGVIGGLEWHKNNRDLMFLVSSARSPTDAYSLDAETGKVERWTESETGGLNPATFAEPELVRWTSFDGRSISGFLFRPPAAKFPGKRPVIINIHGGPESQSRPSFNGRYNYFLNELGCAVIFPNVRGSSGYGKEFLTLDNGFKREDSVKDIGALFDWIATQQDLDSDRIMVTGGSYGGFMTLAVATTYNDRIRAALSVVGISNIVTFLERTESYRRDLRRAEYGDERDEKMRDFLTRMAPLNNAQKITKPLFVVQGRNDPRVPYTEAEQMVATVRKNGSPVWFLMANDEGHGFAKKRNADYLFYATVMFVQEHVFK
jgi:dipeptidyl aminopeptidase/acylaminoacyl peptidase